MRVRTTAVVAGLQGVAMCTLAKKANRNLVIQTKYLRGTGEGATRDCSRYLAVASTCRGTQVQRHSESGPERLMSLLHGGYHSRVPSSTTSTPGLAPPPICLLKLRLALSGSGSRNDPLHMLVPCTTTPRLLLESALRCAALRCAVLLLPACAARRRAGRIRMLLFTSLSTIDH